MGLVRLFLWPEFKARIGAHFVGITFLTLFLALVTATCVLFLLDLYYFNYLPLRDLQGIAFIDSQGFLDEPIARAPAPVFIVRGIEAQTPDHLPQITHVLLVDDVQSPTASFLSSRFQLQRRDDLHRGDLPLVAISWPLAQQMDVQPGDELTLRPFNVSESPDLQARISVVYQPILLPVVNTRSFVLANNSDILQQWQRTIPSNRILSFQPVLQRRADDQVRNSPAYMLRRADIYRVALVKPLRRQLPVLLVVPALYVLAFAFFWRAYLRVRSKEMWILMALGAGTGDILRLLATTGGIRQSSIAFLAFFLVIGSSLLTGRSFVFWPYWLSLLFVLLTINALCLLSGLVMAVGRLRRWYRWTAN